MAALIFPIGFYINEVGGQPYKLPNNTVVGSSYVLFVLSIFFTIVGLLFAGKVCLPGWGLDHACLWTDARGSEKCMGFTKHTMTENQKTTNSGQKPETGKSLIMCQGDRSTAEYLTTKRGKRINEQNTKREIWAQRGGGVWERAAEAVAAPCYCSFKIWPSLCCCSIGKGA